MSDPGSTLTTEEKHPPSTPANRMQPDDCPYYGRALPDFDVWECSPGCPLAQACCDAWEDRQNGGSNGKE